MKFEREKKSSLLAHGLPEVHFKEIAGNFAIVADSEGVYFKGESPKFRERGELEEFIKTTGKAMLEHTELSKHNRSRLLIPGRG